MNMQLTRDQAFDEAQKIADETLAKTWVVRVVAGERHAYENVPGYEARTEQPRADEDIYRDIHPRPINNSVDKVTLIMIKECGWMRARAYFATIELAQEYAAKFPKSLKVRARNVSGCDQHGKSIHYGMADADIKLSSDDVNKGVNESGLARLRRIQKLAPSIIFDESQ